MNKIGREIVKAVIIGIIIFIILQLMNLIVNQNLPLAVIHNRNHQDAHHDIILPTNLGCIPVSVKASFDYVTGKMNEQRLVSKTSSTNVIQLIWLYYPRRGPFAIQIHYRL